MEKTWFEKVFRRRPHPVLRLLGNLAEGVGQLAFAIIVITHFHSAWRWLVVAIGLLGMVGSGRGVVLAMQDLRRRDAALTPE